MGRRSSILPSSTSIITATPVKFFVIDMIWKMESVLHRLLVLDVAPADGFQQSNFSMTRHQRYGARHRLAVD